MNHARFTLGIIILNAFVAYWAMGNPRHETLRVHQLRDLFVPVGFDDNDDVVIVIAGYTGGDCYKLLPPQVSVDNANRMVNVTTNAEQVRDFCHTILLSFSQVVRIGTLPAGTYTVRADGKLTQPLTVKVAAVATQDDYPYAPVESIHLAQGGGGELSAVLRGQFTDTCQRIDRIQVNDSGLTLEVLPILKLTDRDAQGNACAPATKAFEEKVALPKKENGDYLLHTRIANGLSLNQVFEVPYLWSIDD